MVSFSGFSVRVMLVSSNGFGYVPSSLNFWKSLEGQVLNLWMFGRVHQQSEAIESYNFVCCQVFDYQFSLLTSKQSAQILGTLYVPRNFSIPSQLFNLLVYNCSQQSLMSLHISVVSVITSFISDCVYLSLLFSWRVQLKFANFAYLFKELVLSFIDTVYFYLLLL